MELKTRDEAAAYLRVSTRTLDRLIAERKIRAARIGGERRGRVVFDQADLEAFVRRRFVAGIG